VSGIALTDFEQRHLNRLNRETSKNNLAFVFTVFPRNLT
jgi:hypothetical protein